MAFCAHCGNQMSDQAVACPNCGHPNELRAPVSSGLRTPAGVYAGFGVRLVAALLDNLLLSASFFVIGSKSLGVGYLLFRISGPFLYRWLMLAFANGQTLGKMALHVRIASPDGSRIGVGQAAAREGMAFVSGLALGLGYLWAAWDPENRTWHDMVANTRAFRV